jgi:hypothetical protein
LFFAFAALVCLLVDPVLGGIVEHAHFEKLRILKAAEDEFAYPAFFLNVGVAVYRHPPSWEFISGKPGALTGRSRVLLE